MGVALSLAVSVQLCLGSNAHRRCQTHVERILDMIRWELYAPDGITVFRSDYDDTLYSVLIPVETNRCRHHDDDIMCTELTQWVDDNIKELAKKI